MAQDAMRSRLGRRLLPSAWWSLAGAAWLGSVIVLGVLAWHLHRTGGGTRVDASLDVQLSARLGGHRRLLDTLISLGSPAGVAVESVGLAALMVTRAWWRGALLAVLGAPLAGALTELLLKPAVGVAGSGGVGLGFPSGHTTGAVGMAVSICVLLLPHPSVSLFPAVLRILLGLGALCIGVGTGVAMVASGYHTATDVVGGVATATLVVLAVAAALDLVLPARS